MAITFTPNTETQFQICPAADILTPSTETQHPTCLAGSLGNLLEQLRIHISLDLSLNCLRLAYLLGWLVTLLLAPLLDAVECHSQQTYHVLLLTLRPSIVSQSTDLPSCGTVPQAYCLCECHCQPISSTAQPQLGREVTMFIIHALQH